ncbi:MAG: RNA polymerase factor sigma-32 [bacterium]|nr:RNA polymerase factor sigma-32 [bacterium]
MLPSEGEQHHEESKEDLLDPIEAKSIDVDVLEDLDPGLSDLSDLVEIEPSAKESSAVVTYDPLKAYLSEVAQHPKISKEEEKALAIKFKETGDLDAAYKLIVSNLWLVVAIARKYQRAARSVLDLIQEGNIGLMDAVKSFDPYRDVRFPSYASWWIKAYIVRFVIANWRLVKIGTTQAQRKLFFNLEKEREKLEKQGFVPTSKLLAENLNVKESEVIEMQQRLGGSDVSVDAPLSSDSDASSLHSILPSAGLSIEESLAAEEIKLKIIKVMQEFTKTLNPKELAIYEKRLLSDEKATLQEIAEEFSLSKERIRQLEGRIKEKLKVFLKEKLGKEFIAEDLGIDLDHAE